MTKKKSLGRGLSALLGDVDLERDIGLKRPTKNELLESLEQIPLDKFIANREQPRQKFDDEKLKELAASLKSVGLIEPVVVSRLGDKFEIIAGERRFRAAKLAGFKSLPALVKNTAQDKVLEMILIENIQREDLTPIEEAGGYDLLLRKKELTHENLAQMMGKSRAYITNLLRLLTLPADIKKHLNEGRLSVGQAKVLVSLDDKPRDTLVKKILSEGLSTREVEMLAARGKTSKETSVKKTSRRDPDIENLEERIRERLKTKVVVQPLRNKVGKLLIEYYSYDNLEEILRKIGVKQ